jgi:uncharacterized metal-binding protein YceD (DUF177 family)
LIVDVARLNRTGERFCGVTGAEVVDLGEDVVCRPEGGIRYDLRAELVDGELLVRGCVSLALRCTCCRCAEAFPLEVAEPAFFADYPVQQGNEFVDLTPEMREAIILALPGYPVCREECKGLCAGCGANLNQEKCTCGPAPGAPWAALDVRAKTE